MQVAPSDLARELANRPTVLLASAEFLASTEQSNQSRSRFQKFVNGCNLLLIPPYLLPWYWVTMNRRPDWEIRNAIETNTSVVNWEIHLRYTWCWVTMNRRLDWEIRNAGETNTSVVKVRNTLDKNLAKLGEDTLGVPMAMLMNFFGVSQLILKVHAWAVPKMPHFGENSDIWLRYRPSKLKFRFLGTPAWLFLKSGGDPVYH